MTHTRSNPRPHHPQGGTHPPRLAHPFAAGIALFIAVATLPPSLASATDATSSTTANTPRTTTAQPLTLVEYTAPNPAEAALAARLTAAPGFNVRIDREPAPEVIARLVATPADLQPRCSTPDDAVAVLTVSGGDIDPYVAQLGVFQCATEVATARSFVARTRNDLDATAPVVIEWLRSVLRKDRLAEGDPILPRDYRRPVPTAPPKPTLDEGASPTSLTVREGPVTPAAISQPEPVPPRIRLSLRGIVTGYPIDARWRAGPMLALHFDFDGGGYLTLSGRVSPESIPLDTADAPEGSTLHVRRGAATVGGGYRFDCKLIECRAGAGVLVDFLDATATTPSGGEARSFYVNPGLFAEFEIATFIYSNLFLTSGLLVGAGFLPPKFRIESTGDTFQLSPLLVDISFGVGWQFE